MKYPRIQICGTHSGSGKTTVTCGLLRALAERKIKVASFKCGPDYIDPMFHSRMLQTPCRNLDIFMCGEEGVKSLFCTNAATAQVSVIEGVMGMYDGIGFADSQASSTHVALLTKTPQILVVDVKGMSVSTAAVVKGFMDFDKNLLAGVILNNCSEAMYPSYQGLIESHTGLRVFGHLPKIPQATIGSRHLGLVTADEIADLSQRLDLLGAAAAKFLDLDGILQLAAGAETLSAMDSFAGLRRFTGVRIAIAKDTAFSFLYEDSLAALRACGAELVPFSPLQDSALPDNLNGIYLCGGYPEEFADPLSANTSMRQSILNAAAQGMPILAECGGFMYLLDALADRSGRQFAMVGALSGKAWMTEKLCRFGYVTLTAEKDNLLCQKGEKIRAHEFHYSDSDHNGDGFMAQKGSRQYGCIHCTDSIFAGYPHIHLGGQPKLAQSFVEKCSAYHSLAKDAVSNRK